MRRGKCPPIVAAPTARGGFIESLEPRLLLSRYGFDRDLQAMLDTPRLRRAGRGVAIVESAQPDLTPLAPAPSGTFNGITFDSDAALSGFYHIPPDNTAAAGPSHVVTVVNTSIEFFTKAGVKTSSLRLGHDGDTDAGSFFDPLNPVNGTFDPKVIYDQYNGRFVVVTLEQQDTAFGDPANTSRILVAASDDGDPNGTWFYQSINSLMSIGGTNRWADFPGLGVSAGALYVTANMFGFGFSGTFGGSRLWIINKTGLYGGGAGAVTLHNPSTSAGLSSQNFTMQPAHMFGAAPGSAGTFLVASGWTSGPNEALSVIRVDNPTSSPTFTNQFISAGNIHNSGGGSYAVPQAGSSFTLDGGDIRIYNAVWRNNALWASNTILPASGADKSTPTAHWYKINTTSLSSLSLSDQGNAGAEDLGAGTRTFYPSIMVDGSGNMALNFSASSSSIFAGAYYTGRLATDPAGTVQSTATLAAGVAPYYRTFGGGANRWGDYSGISLDPTDNATFWLFNQYAMAQGTVFEDLPDESGRWATRVGKFSFTPAATGSITGKTFDDYDGDDVPDGGEPARPGVLVYIDADSSGTFTGGDPNVLTDASGNYTFGSLAAGTYNIRQQVPAGFISTVGNHNVVLAAGGTSTNNNFGEFRVVHDGTSGNDAYTLRRDIAGTKLEVVVGAITWSKSLVQINGASTTGLDFNLAAGDDLLTIDYVNGAPMPNVGVDYDGGGQSTASGDRLVILGTSAAETYGVFNNRVTRTGDVNSPFYAGLEGITLNGLAGGDTINVTSAPSIPVTVNGGDGNDTMNVNAAPLAALVFNGGLNALDADTLNVNAGTFTFNADANVGTANLQVNVSNAGSGVLFNATQHLAGLALQSGSVATMPPNGNRYLFTKDLDILAGATLDLSDNDLLWDYTGGSPYLDVRSFVVDGRIATTPLPSNNTVLAPVDNAVYGASEWLGQTIDATTIIGKYTYYGDANLDGRVTSDDYVAVDVNLGGVDKQWIHGDFNFDGNITSDEYVAIDVNLGQGEPVPL